MPTPNSRPRFAVSFRPEEVLWLHSMLTMARRCVQTAVIMRSDEAARVSRIVLAAATKAELVPKEALVRTVPLRVFPGRSQQRTACMRGHELTDENSYQRNDGARRCRTCRRVLAAKSRVAKLRARLAEAVEQERRVAS